MRGGDGTTIVSGLRAARRAANLSQAGLAALAGTHRQTVAALEAELYAPTMGVALRLARALKRDVGELFWLQAARPTVAAELLAAGDTEPAPSRVQVARVGGRTLARPPTAYTPADGIVVRREGGEGSAGDVTVERLAEPALLERTAVVLGCDPALATLGAHLARRHAGCRLAAVNAGSLAALDALARGEAHVAGMHLLDEATGEYNLPYVRRAFAGRRVLVVTATHWAQGLIVARGNPRGIAGVADLARPDLSIVNRELGAGSRAALAHALRLAGVAPAGVRGYGRQVSAHGAAAEAVAAGLADAAPGIQAAAETLGLGFVPLGHERYDLIIPAEHREAPPVQALLDTLASPAFRAEIDALPGYDV